jgi:release factor glutamine methyltransferase
MGTGSGAISIVLARAFPSASLVATDLSAKALVVAQENASRLGVGERIQFLRGDLFVPLENESAFEMIITNPPYIAEEDFPSLPPEVRGFEPRLALDGGKDGLNFFRRVLLRVGEFLNPGGWFLAEIGAGQEDKIRQIAEGNPEIVSCGFVPDLAGIERVFKARKK